MVSSFSFDLPSPCARPNPLVPRCSLSGSRRAVNEHLGPFRKPSAPGARRQWKHVYVPTPRVHKTFVQHRHTSVGTGQWVVPTNQRGIGREERKRAETGVLWVGQVPTHTGRAGRCETPKSLCRCGITTRPAGVVQRAVIGQRAFRNDTLTGGAGNRTRVP